MKPVCVPCQRFFRIEKTGFYFLEMMPTEPLAKPGTAEPEKWKPYKLQVGDKWKCPSCRATILSGFGRAPISEHFEADFAELRARFNADQLHVNDC